jgi:hypothetical protein
MLAVESCKIYHNLKTLTSKQTCTYNYLYVYQHSLKNDRKKKSKLLLNSQLDIEINSSGLKKTFPQ